MAPNYGYGTWEIACSQCGQNRFVRTHRYKDGKFRASQNTCQACRAIRLSKRVEVKCPRCGIIRSLGVADARQRLSEYCQACVKHHSRRGIRKDGRRINVTSRGYVLVLGMRGHPAAKRNTVLEHWLTLYDEHPMGHQSVLWFKDQGFTIHHKNGNRQDNTFENLELRAPSRHPAGWSIDEMREVIRRYDKKLSATHIESLRLAKLGKPAKISDEAKARKNAAIKAAWASGAYANRGKS